MSKRNGESYLNMKGKIKLLYWIQEREEDTQNMKDKLANNQFQLLWMRSMVEMPDLIESKISLLLKSELNDCPINLLYNLTYISYYKIEYLNQSHRFLPSIIIITFTLCLFYLFYYFSRSFYLFFNHFYIFILFLHIFDWFWLICI